MTRCRWLPRCQLRTTIRIDEALYRRVKARAGATGQTVSEVIESAVRDALRPRPASTGRLAPLPTFGGSGVMPGVDLADSPALRDLMDEGVPPNVLVSAHRPEAPDHDRVRQWLEDARTSPQPLGLPAATLSGFLRVVTHPRVFREPTPLKTALASAEALRRGPASRDVGPGERHWSIFRQLCEAVGARGNLVPDAYLAAIAIEHGATLVTVDRGFARFPELRWSHPLDERLRRPPSGS
jgi:toxin-antitoxin system PIN domain toxin